jgi:hypothetical protein
MSGDERRTAFAVAAVIVALAAVALTVARPATPAPSHGPATPAGAAPTTAGAKPLVAAGSDAGGAPVPPGAWQAARAVARREAGVHRAEVLSIQAADDPATPSLEMAVTTGRGGRKTTLVLLLAAKDGAWQVTGSR